MAINTLEMAKIFQQSLDKQMGIEATSGWMESNAVNVKYNGGDTVRMPRISTTGMARYDRDNGFNQGAVTLTYDDYKLTQDRGRTFHLDSMDVDESNFIATAGNVMGEFQRLQVIPEVDAYSHTSGIHVCGNFEEAEPTAAQIESTAMLLANLCADYGLSIDRDTIVGHRELMATACPGRNLYEMMDTVVGKANFYANQ